MVILERITLAYFLSILKGKQVSVYQAFPKKRHKKGHIYQGDANVFLKTLRVLKDEGEHSLIPIIRKKHDILLQG